MLWRVDKTIDDQLCRTRAPYAQSQVSLITLSVINIIIISSVDLSWFAAHGKNSKASTVCSFPSLPFSTPTLSSWRSQLRDELRMTLLAFQTLYESSIAFGIRWIQFNSRKMTSILTGKLCEQNMARPRWKVWSHSWNLRRQGWRKRFSPSWSSSWNHFVWSRFRGNMSICQIHHLQNPEITLFDKDSEEL